MNIFDLSLARLYENKESYFCHPHVGVDVGVGSHTFLFYDMMGKALLGQLSCTGTDFVWWLHTEGNN